MANINQAVDRDAFNGFGTVWYPYIEIEENAAVCDADLMWSLTACSNIDGYPYVLDAESIVLLAKAHAMFGDDCPNICDAFAELVPNITAVPMYPDFPKQVMEIDEVAFRIHQMLHYMSTYGIEQMLAMFGAEGTVRRGWLPGVESTEKTRQDDGVGIEKQVIKLAFGADAMYAAVAARLGTATRMHDSELSVAVKALSNRKPSEWPTVRFKENAEKLCIEAMRASTNWRMLSDTLIGIAQHPGDVLRMVPIVSNANGNGSGDGKRKRLGHLTTSQKRAFCHALDSFDADALASEIADVGSTGRRWMSMLSLSRFGSDKVRNAFERVATGEVKSWNSRVEGAWVRASSNGGWNELLAIYTERPGILLRTLTRFAKADAPADLVADALVSVAGRLSIPSMVRVLAIAEGVDTNPQYRNRYAVRTAFGEFKHGTSISEHADYISSVLERALMKRLSMLDTPLLGKTVALATNGVSLDGSVLMPNDNGETGTAWPPVGIAFNLPDDGTVRFFTFWDDRDKRVDVDLHFYGEKLDGTTCHIGWDGDFRSASMCTSGDITHSENAVEYLDIDMAKAKAEGVKTVCQKNHIYYGATSWGDIATCRSGATVVGSTEKDVILYDGNNLIFRDDMDGDGTSMAYALIDVQEGWVRISRGVVYPFIHTKFSLGRYLSMFFKAQGVKIASVDGRVLSDEIEGDTVLPVSIGRSENGALSLSDNMWFLGAANVKEKVTFGIE